MDFELPLELKALQEEARLFAEAEFSEEYALRCETRHRYPVELRRQAGEAGLIAPHLPQEYGGRDAGLLGSILVGEAFCRRDPGLGTALGLSSLGSHLILRHGTGAQRESILPRITSGEINTGVAFTEPDNGSDISDVSTMAVREGDSFLITGTKTMISNAQNAHVIAILCKTDTNVDIPRRGLSLILVELHRDGFATEDLGAKMGLKMMSTGALILSRVRVPAANLLGQLNRGFYQTLGFLNDSRVEIAAHALGGAQAALDRATAHVRERRQFGKRLADLQATQHKIADMATKVESARLLVYRAAWTRDQGREDPVLSSMAKLYAARVAVEVAEEAMQLCGGSGYFLSGGLERIYRDVRVTEIYEGTREIQKNTIASRLLAEPWDVAPQGLDVDIIS